jgi:hypothetical protein
MHVSFPMWIALALTIGCVIGGVATLVALLFLAVLLEDPDEEAKRRRPPAAVLSTGPPTFISNVSEPVSVKNITYH